MSMRLQGGLQGNGYVFFNDPQLWSGACRHRVLCAAGHGGLAVSGAAERGSRRGGLPRRTGRPDSGAGAEPMEGRAFAGESRMYCVSSSSYTHASVSLCREPADLTPFVLRTPVAQPPTPCPHLCRVPGGVCDGVVWHGHRPQQRPICGALGRPHEPRGFRARVGTCGTGRRPGRLSHVRLSRGRQGVPAPRVAGG